MHWSEDYPVPLELTKEDINNIVKAFGSAAARAVKAGYDMVEVHACPWVSYS